MPSSSAQYNFTQSGYALTPEQREFYEQNGYIVIPDLIRKQDLNIWVDRFHDYCDGKLERKMGMAIVRDLSTIKRIKGGEKLSGVQIINKI